MILKSAAIDENFGILIKQGREKRGLTQENLAEQIGVDHRTIQRWEAEDSIPWPSCVEKIVGILPEIVAPFRLAIKKILVVRRIDYVKLRNC